MDELFHFLNRICCIQNGAADGYTINTDRHDVGNIGQRDSANAHKGIVIASSRMVFMIFS